MHIAISSTHFIDKSTLIDDFVKHHPNYRSEIESYYKLQEEKTMELSLSPSLDSLLEQLNSYVDEPNNIFFSMVLIKE